MIGVLPDDEDDVSGLQCKRKMEKKVFLFLHIDLVKIDCIPRVCFMLLIKYCRLIICL